MSVETDGERAPSGVGRPRRWTLSNLLWLVDGEWDVTTVANRVVLSREGVDVVVSRRRRLYRATTYVDGREYNDHRAPTLPEAFAGVRRDLRAAGV